MNPIVINGTVLCDPITGIPRFVYEVVTRLDPLLEGTGLDVRLCYRDDGRPLHLPELKNIKIVPLKAIKYSYNLVVLPRYLRKHHAFYVGLASDMLMTRRSVVVLHDIRPLVMKTDRAFFRFKFWFHCLSTKWFARRVFTVSDNQRHLISERLGIPLDKIGVTYNYRAALVIGIAEADLRCGSQHRLVVISVRKLGGKPARRGERPFAARRIAVYHHDLRTCLRRLFDCRAALGRDKHHLAGGREKTYRHYREHQRPGGSEYRPRVSVLKHLVDG